MIIMVTVMKNLREGYFLGVMTAKMENLLNLEK